MRVQIIKFCTKLNYETFNKLIFRIELKKLNPSKNARQYNIQFNDADC